MLKTQLRQNETVFYFNQIVCKLQHKKKNMKAHKKYEQETCGMQESKMQLMEAGQSRLQGTSFV